MSSTINALNITSENITVTNLNVTNINGKPYTGANGCGSYYTSCPSCDGNSNSEEPCVDCGYVEPDIDPCDCFVPNPCLGPQGATGAIGAQGATGTFSPSGINYGDYLYWNTNTSPNQWAVGDTNINIGGFAGVTGQQIRGVALGYQAGQISQGQSAIAIGYQAGNSSQGNNAIAIGNQAGYTGQGFESVSIGYQAGQINQGISSIAIGPNAGQTSQHDNTIILNARGFLNPLNSVASNSFYVAPIRTATQTNVLGYNTSNNEITYYNFIGAPLITTPITLNTLTVNFGNYYQGTANTTITSNTTINIYSFTNDVASGQYSITFTINSGSTLTLNAVTPISSTYRVSFASVSATGSGSSAYIVLTVLYDGSRYYLSAAAFNN
jgi:hypothetical protein